MSGAWRWRKVRHHGEGGWRPPIAVHRGGADGVSQDDEFGGDPADAPGRILRREPRDESSSLHVNRGATGPGAATLLAPIPAPRQAMPAHDGRRLHQVQMGPPRGPPPRRDRPELPVPLLEPRAPLGSFPDRQLLAQNQVLQDQIASTSPEDPEPTKKEPPIEPHALPSAERLPARGGSLKADRVLEHHRYAWTMNPGYDDDDPYLSPRPRDRGPSTRSAATPLGVRQRGLRRRRPKLHKDAHDRYPNRRFLVPN